MISGRENLNCTQCFGFVRTYESNYQFGNSQTAVQASPLTVTVLGRPKSVTVTGIFSIRRSFFGPKKCHSNRNVTVTGVTVSGEACINIFK